MMILTDRPARNRQAILLFVLLAIAGPPAFVMFSDRLFGPAPPFPVSVALQMRGDN